jgi:hypothetical protein
LYQEKKDALHGFLVGWLVEKKKGDDETEDNTAPPDGGLEKAHQRSPTENRNSK